MTLHLPTVLFFAGLLTVAMTVGIGLLAYRERRDYLWHWTAALASTFVGMVLFAVRGSAPDLLTVVLANMLLLGNLLFTLSGYQRLFRHSKAPRGMGALVFVQLIAFLWLTYGLDHYPSRVHAFNSTLAALSLASAHLLWQQRHRLGWTVLALPVIAHLLHAGIGVTRIVMTLTDAGGVTSLHAASQAHVVAIMLNSFAAIALAFGFLALHAGDLLEELNEQASTDALTGLLNRRGFDPALQLEWERHRRLSQPLALLLIDIDHFKRINDLHGHAAGDAALRHLGQVLRQHLRPYDLSARIGGEEFCVVQSGVHPEEARQTAERLRKADLCFGLDAQGEAMRMTISIGLATARPEDTEPAQLLARADTALYLAKAEGRNRVMPG
ncbi:GGDEF domain-containing protein [Inhella sp.]|uniref:GGDEF domain-containing protein n=1 Tax=Inhella sp. TaxID=1921806 RepID=UPI0035AF2013